MRIQALSTQSGNVFFAIFGAVALVGVLTAGVATFVKGPLATSVKITRMNTAENQMSIAGQVAVMAAANAPGGGDCDGDTFVEPLEWREDLAKPFPVGGGLIPMSIGISKKDPWGTEYGYCVWDHGAANNGAGTCGGATQKRLEGHNSKIYPVVALISAGPDKAFTTTCRSFDDADVNDDDDLEDAGSDFGLVQKANSSDDDIIFTYTYEEATGASGGLWSLKSGDPGTAIIDKKIESTGVGSFAGGVLLPDSSLITCDPTTAGIMARSASGDGIQICDGTGWQEISGGVSTPYGAGLVIDPNSSSGMNIAAPCGNAICYSGNVVFAVVNKLVPPAASDVLGVTLSNTANFDKVSDTCIGNSIPAGGNCQITIRAKATGDRSYTGILSIVGNNSPIANLDGISAGFGCNVGGDAPSGKYVACNLGGYNLITTPGGCTNSTTNPTCAGGADTIKKDSCNALLADYSAGSNGQQNTADFASYAGATYVFPAVQYCDALEYGGFSDWFLPSVTELQNYLYPARTAIGGSLGTVLYVSSTMTNNNVSYMNSAGGNENSTCGNTSGGNALNVRCLRWDPPKAVVPVPDSLPDPIVFQPSTGSANETRTSNTVRVTGIAGSIPISVSGGASAQYSINGNAYTSSAGTVADGDQIALRATSPALGLESVVSLTIGSSNFSWQIRTPGNNTIRIFTTAGTYNGSRGGVGGADSDCTTAANSSGLPGAWVAVMANGTAGNTVSSRLPWNWKTLQNMNGQTVAVSLDDFMDGTVSAVMNYTQTGGTPASSFVWTGLATNGISPNCAYWACNPTQVACGGWASASASYSGSLGDSSTTSGGSYLGSIQGNCASGYRLLCMESNAAGVDTDPNPVSIRPQVTFASGGTGTSNTVTISGVTDEVLVTITPSAGTVDIIKDGSPVGANTTMAGLNQTLVFTLTAPGILGTKNTATINLGPDTYTWWVGYADSSKEVKAFVGTLASAGNTGGLTGANSRCNSLAASSPLGLSGSWTAMLSDSNSDMANVIPWNWGVLKTTTGALVADGGYTDLLDGSLDGPINWNEKGSAVSATAVATGFTPLGFRSNGTASSGYACNWTDGSNSCGSTTYGHSSSAGGNWAQQGVTSSAYVYHLYCIENTDSSADMTPNDFSIPYAIQVPTSSRQTSESLRISGMSNGVTQTLSVSATGGAPKFKINGGAELTSGSIQNGDDVVFLMDAPAGGNSSNRMTITAGGMTSYWRVWTGDITGSSVKRMFVATYANPTWGGLAGFDAHCQSKATGAALGGTWKAILSGDTEANWAVNRIGYNWSTLKRIDGVDLVSAGNIWSTSTLPLLSTPTLNESGAVVSANDIMSNTTSFGKAKLTTGTYGSCTSFTTNSSSYYTPAGSTGTNTSQWIENNNWSQCYTCCGSSKQFYCIEQ